MPPITHADWLAGGVGQEMTNFTGNKVITGSIAVGTNPAHSGAVRIPSAAYLVARNHAGDGDIQLIGTDNSNNIVMRTPDSVGFRATGNGYASMNNANNSYISLAPTDAVDVAGGSGSAGLFIAADGSISITPDTGKLVTLGALAVPTSDPAVAGAIFTVDAAGLAAALGAGARYLLVSVGP